MNLERAHEFLWTHARLLERRIFEHHFLDGAAEAVERAVSAYRNADGGFGQALEPDCRTPHSQPEAMRWALAVLDGAGCLNEERAGGCADWLASVSTPDGGVPFCLISVDGYPKAPWWKPVPTADLNPTGSLVGLLRRHVPGHPWVRRAAGWCWERALGDVPESQYQAHPLADFLITEPDQERARPVLDALGEALAGGRVVPLDPMTRGSAPDIHTPLQFATSPAHPLRRFFSGVTIEGFLDRLIADQREDGGWPIDWPAPGTTATYEWRAIRTLEALQTLSAYGRL
ncbi:MAG: hypothetical protein ACREI8_10015 [Myxococcota bacterium]